MTSSQPRSGPWIGLSGDRRFWPLDPRPSEFRIEDIAGPLSRICRFGGRCSPFYSVAEHSLLVMRIVEEAHPDIALQALLHDAAEAYLGDVISPLKEWLVFWGPCERKPTSAAFDFAAMERHLHTAILIGLGVPVPSTADAAIIKQADEIALATEARQLMGDPEWGRIAEPRAERLAAMDHAAAQRAFLAAFYRLAPKAVRS